MSRDTQLVQSQLYHPKDELTTLYNQVMAINHKLPPPFYNKTTAESYGRPPLFSSKTPLFV